MAYHEILVDKKVSKNGKNFLVHEVKKVEVALSGTEWVWKEVDSEGHHVEPVHRPFDSEQAALDDAVTHFGGELNDG
ncbi:MAG TPA: hypothetical protein DHW36_09700 [Thalassospira sp.]|nr:hypothetical protein [Thalassospira sp.]|tara:strand:- start:1704 stop:1934 length:231 start_codon:yes stop_codon:yes gene_type:complete